MRYEAFLIAFGYDVDPVVLLIQDMHDLTPLDLELVVDARCEIVEDDHLGLGAEAVLLLDSDSNEGLDGG